ncbi:hypothetical protein [Paraburkholderia diazotrophica]|uniref:Uncharacterized protein n=1 Tax=Paraburkholderia diazotrophica TaxID=667676 RepID=A0A1H6UW65_9BURK|nr:hypothetical protein [Paraburkholderia diazotrophica]SEI96481.1 hypothetical protein SAMN05192539_1005220 [Paraburkholderia diazotrophica]
MTLKTPIAAAIVPMARAGRSIARVCLDRCGSAETALAEPLALLRRAQKAIDGLVLQNHPNAVVHIGEVQSKINHLIEVIQSVLPRQGRTYSMEKAAPVVAPLLGEIPALIDLVAGLNVYVPETGELWR